MVILTIYAAFSAFWAYHHAILGTLVYIPALYLAPFLISFIAFALYKTETEINGYMWALLWFICHVYCLYRTTYSIAY